jgi:hypothetical protein
VSSVSGQPRLQIAERCAPPLELQHNSRDFASGIESVRFTVIRESDLFMLVPTPSGSSPPSNLCNYGRQIYFVILR